MVADLLVYECAVVTTREQRPETDNLGNLPSKFSLDLTRDIYAQYYEFDGIYYVKTLMNSRGKEGNCGRLLFSEQKYGLIQHILVAEDHVGIRSVQFVSSNTVPEPCLIPGVWWTSISGLGGITKVIAHTDVSRATAYLYLRLTSR
jgi:hypothetical protein